MRTLFITAFLFTAALGFSQKQELGKVTVDELKEKACPFDTSAVAAYLFNVGKTYFTYSEGVGFELITEISTKIKIYKEEGYKYASQSVRSFSSGSGTEKVDFSKAVTYNLVDGKIEKTKLGSDGEFVEKLNKNWESRKITMPNVKVGSIIEYKIEIKSPFKYNFPDWEFQKSIPVNYSQYTTHIPEYYIYNKHSKGFLVPERTEVKAKNTIMMTVKSGMGIETKYNTDSHEYEETKTVYTLTNVPALKDESFVNNINNYRATIEHELSGRKWPNEPYENFNTDWESVAKRIYQNDAFGLELGKTGYFEKDIDLLIKEMQSRDERISAIFNYVKTKMNWDESYGIYCDSGVKKAYQDNKGNAAEINLMLTAMLRYAGIDANPILVSTRANGISLFPSTSAYNYVIAGIELENQVVLLDATSKYSLPDILPIRDLNWKGRIIRKNESSAEISLMPKTNSKDNVIIIAGINLNGDVSGKIRDQYFDYNAFLFRQNNNTISKDSYIEKLEKRHQGLEVGEYEVQNSKELDKPLVENYSFTATNSVEIIGDKMYVSPFLFFTETENPFKQETREYPVDFVFPHQDKFSITLTLPDGYAIETLPESKAMSMDGNLGSFKYMITQKENQIQLSYVQDINQAIISSEHYAMLKNFYKEIVNKQTEKIVLKKI